MSFKMTLNNRASYRRVAKHQKKQGQYRTSGFDEARYIFYVGVKVRPSKYTPHIGAKQRSKAVA